jgi:hypothetical protein
MAFIQIIEITTTHPEQIQGLGPTTALERQGARV